MRLVQRQMSFDQENKLSYSNRRMRTLGTLINPPVDNPDIPAWPYVIGLAGGVASGKSKIIEKLKTKGVAIVNCDRIANEKKLRKVAFADEEQPKQQDQLTWPAVIEEAQRRIQEFGEEGYRVVIMEGADFMRAKWYQYCHQLWVVVVPRDEAIKRLQDRDRISAAEAAKRVDSQVSNQELEAHANVIFNPLWSFKHTEGQVDRAWKQLEEFLHGRDNLE
ncbi:hypothetical protein PYW08_004584 [Mythimna loreyi]|uniref:Uncharacterized protein n=1 Tax=Mythimna loreyi TaxID=667449 RepID=A0ACC2QRA0_9NEOP|nr:hypothetical protein PYW08_004584 [Mythimna loreyi]